MRRQTILPGSTIGMVGGGQLGRMTAIEAKKMGYDVICLDPVPNSPCGQVADEQIIASLDDWEGAKLLGEKTDVVLYEFENIDATVVKGLEERFYVPQGSFILGMAQNRIEEKTRLQRAGFPVAPFRVATSFQAIEEAVLAIGYPCVLKTSVGGYDGKGQLVMYGIEQLGEARNWFYSVNQPVVVEKMIRFTHEVSVIVARNGNGEAATYPVGENIHRNNILHMTIVPARIPLDLQQQAREMALDLANTFGVVGILAIEFFVINQSLLVNELAPRPHNSGHYTWDGCYISQFEQFVRSTCGLPLGTTELLTPLVMVNILGKHVSPVLEKLSDFPDHIKLHLYGKAGKPSPQRKMGHLTIKAHQPEQAIEWVKEIWDK